MGTNKKTEDEVVQTAAAPAEEVAEDPVEKAKKEAEEILKAAKEEAEKIKKAAEKKAAAQAKGAAKDEDMVEIRLFKDADRYKDDVTVVLNGRVFQIKRGETVKVPKAVAEILDNQARQEKSTAELIERETAEFQAKSRELGL